MTLCSATCKSPVPKGACEGTSIRRPAAAVSAAARRDDKADDLGDANRDDRYYEHWLAALEHLVELKSRGPAGYGAG